MHQHIESPELNITFVFSDIEHSTRLAQRLRGNYPKILEQHRSVIRDAIARYGGREIDTAGDGFFMTFENARFAVLAAEEIQKKFHSLDWAIQNNLKVRMSVHSGIALPTKSGYTGVEVHKASRICSVARGGQVLVSHTSHDYLNKERGDPLAFAGLGKFTLKDFVEPVELYQLIIPGIKNEKFKPRTKSDEKRVAVLPFLNLSNNSENEYLGTGLAEEIILALGKIQGLRVASINSTLSFQDKNRNAKNIGQKLNVGTVLAGQVKWINKHLRISAALIDTKTGFNIWSGQYDTSKEHLVYLQDEITNNIVNALNLMTIPEQLNSIKHRQTHSVEAYDWYLRGRRFYLQFSVNGIELALKMFEKAIEADNEYALAYAGIADSYSFLYQHKLPSESTLNKAEEVCKRAIEIDPSLAETHVTKGIIQGLRLDFEAAEASFKTAIELDPSHFLAWFHYGRTCFAAGHLDKGARMFEQANRVEPDDYQSVLLSSQLYNDIGCHDLSLSLRRRGVELAEKCIELNPGDTRALYLAANALTFLGEKDKSLTLLQRALTLDPNDSMLLFNAGCIYALLCMKPEALSCLERSYQAGLRLRGWYENDSNLDILRDEPRFISLVMKLKDDWKS